MQVHMHIFLLFSIKDVRKARHWLSQLSLQLVKPMTQLLLLLLSCFSRVRLCATP